MIINKNIMDQLAMNMGHLESLMELNEDVLMGIDVNKPLNIGTLNQVVALNVAIKDQFLAISDHIRKIDEEWRQNHE